MMTVISQIIFCMITASVLGFVIGWIFSNFIKNEKHQLQILAVRDMFDEKKEEINQLQTDIDAKDRELMILKEEYASAQKQMQTYNLEHEDNSSQTSQYKELISENQMLIGQIKEQQICEDENEALKFEIDDLAKEKENLMEKIKELEEFKTSYKDNIHKIAELESKQKQQKEEKKSILASKSLDNKICKEKQIIYNSDLTSKGLKEDKLSQLLNDLFLAPKKNGNYET